MTAIALRTPANRRLVCALWGLTVFALIPFPNIACLLVGAVANLASNCIALYLLCSRSRRDRIHGFVRLGLQAATLVVAAIVLARSGVSVEGFVRFILHRTL
jgi:hypothetical protein